MPHENNGTVQRYLRTFGWKNLKWVRARYDELARQVSSGEAKIDDVALECLALVCEASARGKDAKYVRPDQVAGAHGLIRGHIVEMRTGEGKTLAGAVASLVRALDSRTADGLPAPGKGVWWLNPNDMLAHQSFRELNRIAGRE